MASDEESRLLHPEFYGKMYIFRREGMFYPIELGSDDQARENAECNPGTIEVQDIEGRVVWPAKH